MGNMKSFMCCVKLLTQKANVSDPKGVKRGAQNDDVWFRGAQNKCTAASPFAHPFFKPIYEKYTRHPQYVGVSVQKMSSRWPVLPPLTTHSDQTWSWATEETKTKTPNIYIYMQPEAGHSSKGRGMQNWRTWMSFTSANVYLLEVHMKVGYLLANMHQGYIYWYTKLSESGNILQNLGGFQCYLLIIIQDTLSSDFRHKTPYTNLKEGKIRNL